MRAPLSQSPSLSITNRTSGPLRREKEREKTEGEEGGGEEGEEERLGEGFFLEDDLDELTAADV